MSGVSTGPHRTREELEALDPELKRVNVESMRLAATGLRVVEEFNKRDQNYTPAMAFGVSALLLDRAADELTTLRHENKIARQQHAILHDDLEVMTARAATNEVLREQIRNLQHVAHQFKYPPDAKMLRYIADEIDCSPCENLSVEYDTNASHCRKEDDGECPAANAWALREFAKAVEIYSALPSPPQIMEEGK